MSQVYEREVFVLPAIGEEEIQFYDDCILALKRGFTLFTDRGALSYREGTYYLGKQEVCEVSARHALQVHYREEAEQMEGNYVSPNIDMESEAIHDTEKEQIICECYMEEGRYQEVVNIIDGIYGFEPGEVHHPFPAKVTAENLMKALWG